MSTNFIALAAQLPDEALRARVKLLATQTREVTIELIVHLGELGARRLHCAEGPGTLFRYCTDILRLSEAAANNRIRAARAARRFPIILDLLADGSVNMTTIRLLSPHLTAANHRALLDEAKGMTRRQVDKLVARLAPKPDGRPSVMKVPGNVGQGPIGPDLFAAAASPSAEKAPTPVVPSAPMPGPVMVPKTPATISATAPGRYRVKVTIGEQAEEDLRRLQDLLRREIPDGDPGEIVSRALHVLRQQVEKQKCAATSSPRPGREVAAGSRHVAAEVTRTVWARDGGQCAFRAADGRRCTERSYLELHHQHRPFALGGESTVENLALRCRAHNVYEAKRVFGAGEEDREASPYWSRDQSLRLHMPGSDASRHHERRDWPHREPDH